MDDQPPHVFLQIAGIFNSNLHSGDISTIVAGLLAVFVLIVLSAIMSGSENAFFSLNRSQLEELLEQNPNKSFAINYLLRNPKKLLATILIANTLVNVAIVMVTTLVFSIIFNFQQNPVLGFILEVIIVTFVIVLFGEVIPKIYSVQNNMRVVKYVAIPMFSIYKILQPFVWLLENTTSVIDKRITSKGHILTVDELTHAIEITSEKDAPKQEKSLLKSIVNFGNITVNQIMRQRPDIVAIDSTINFKQLLGIINESGYSRLPVYNEHLDNITGILFTKDILPHINNDETFNWLELIRKPYFVPESKKIDDLLRDFQTNRIHLAIVVDEFGGTSGLVTMEDILEEIFGEINDEFDEDENIYSKINDYTYVFEAKLPINDVCRYMELEPNIFDNIRNDADTLGGMLLELNGDLPEEGKILNFKQFEFKIESVDKRKIKRVKVSILK
ncbi:MAG: gliding motility-associated protein GldE [Bacteroidia bacterium]